MLRGKTTELSKSRNIISGPHKNRAGRFFTLPLQVPDEILTNPHLAR